MTMKELDRQAIALLLRDAKSTPGCDECQIREECAKYNPDFNPNFCILN